MAWDTGLDPNGITYAIAAASEPRVRVIAGPGTGKSYAMKRRVARLLRVMSITKSKGLSSPYVFMAGCVEGIMQPDDDPDCWQI